MEEDYTFILILKVVKFKTIFFKITLHNMMEEYYIFFLLLIIFKLQIIYF
jgi:hypothetical protein